MAGKTEAALGPGGEPIVEETQTKKLLRKARPDEADGSGNGNGRGPKRERPKCPLFPYLEDVRSCVIYKGSSVKGGQHILSVTGDEIGKLDEDWVRSNICPDNGWGPYIVVARDPRGHSYDDGQFTMNLRAPASEAVNRNAASGLEQLMGFMQAQLAQQQNTNNTLLLALLKDKQTDGGMATVMAALVTTMGAMASRNGERTTDPVLQAMLGDIQARARQSEADRNSLINKLLEHNNSAGDPFGLISKAANAFGMLADNITDLAGGKNSIHPKVAVVKEIGNTIASVVKDTAPIIASALRKSREAEGPGTPTKLKLIKTVPVSVEPPVETAAPATPGAPSAAPTETPPTPESSAPVAEPTVVPISEQPPVLQPMGRSLVPLEATDTANEYEALRQIDSWLAHGSKTAQDVATLFVHHAETTGAFPKMILGPMANMTELQLASQPARIAAWISGEDPELADNIRKWPDDPDIWTKLTDAMRFVRAHVAASVAEEAQAATAPGTTVPQ